MSWNLFRFKKYNLPDFPAGAAELFESFSVELSYAEFSKLRDRYDEYVDFLTNSFDSKDIKFNRTVVRGLIKALNVLFEAYNDRDLEQKKLIVGAINYFIEDEDGLSDLEYYSGFDDDAQIVNYVLEELEIEGYFIPNVN
jgi:uncharacterized membrane protein YkvA (DUF1232 family)